MSILYFSYDEAKNILTGLNKIDRKYYIIAYISLVTGARLGEIIGTHNNPGLSASSVSVKDNLCFITRQPEKQRTKFLLTTAISLKLAGPILDYVKNIKNTNGRLFEISPRQVQRVFKSVHDTLNCRSKHTFHILRHLHAGTCDAVCDKAKRIAAVEQWARYRLAHAPVTMTDRYRDSVMPEWDKELAPLLDQYLAQMIL
jgi:integrase